MSLKQDIQALNNKIVTAKNSLSEAIVNKGGTSTPSDTLTQMVTSVANIPAGGGTNTNYLIAPEELAKEYSTPTYPWYRDILWKPNGMCYSDSRYILHHFDPDTSTEVANVDANGNQEFTQWLGEMPEFYDLLWQPGGVRILYGYDDDLENIEYIGDVSEQVMYNAQGEEYRFVGTNGGVSLGGSDIVNPIDSTYFSYFSAAAVPTGYYKALSWSGSDYSAPSYIIGANLLIHNDSDFSVTPEGDDTLIFNVSGNCSPITADYLNYFFEEKQYHNIKFIPGQRLPFAKNIKIIDSNNLTDTFAENIATGIFSYSEVEKVDYSFVKGGERVESTGSWFENCKHLTEVKLPDMPNVTNMNSMFYSCSSLLEIPMINTSNVTDMGNMFRDCSSLLETPMINISNATNMQSMFLDCTSLTSVYFVGNPAKVTNVDYMFNRIKPNGTLYYDYRYDYSKIIAALPSTWTAKQDYEITDYKTLTITADDCIGNASTTKVHYTAIGDGVNNITGEALTNITLTGDGISDDFGQNPSKTDPRQVTVSFALGGLTATTTITQGVYVDPRATVNLMNNWELADNSVIPNPDAQIYEGVYQSVHKGQGNVKDTAEIEIVGMPNFELYIRSNAESDFDYVYCSELDSAAFENSNKASTKGKQNAGTALSAYFKVEYPNDGALHKITITYRKDGGGDTGDDRGYFFFTKPDTPITPDVNGGDTPPGPDFGGMEWGDEDTW